MCHPVREAQGRTRYRIGVWKIGNFHYQCQTSRARGPSLLTWSFIYIHTSENGSHIAIIIFHISISPRQAQRPSYSNTKKQLVDNASQQIINMTHNEASDRTCSIDIILIAGLFNPCQSGASEWWVGPRETYQRRQSSFISSCFPGYCCQSYQSHFHCY